MQHWAYLSLLSDDFNCTAQNLVSGSASAHICWNYFSKSLIVSTTFLFFTMCWAVVNNRTEPKKAIMLWIKNSTQYLSTPSCKLDFHQSELVSCQTIHHFFPSILLINAAPPDFQYSFPFTSLFLLISFLIILHHEHTRRLISDS